MVAEVLVVIVKSLHIHSSVTALNGDVGHVNTSALYVTKGQVTLNAL